MRNVLGNRFFEAKPEAAEPARIKLGNFVNGMLELDMFHKLLIAVNVDADRSDAVEFLHDMGRPEVVVIPVTPWGKFVPALSSMLDAASKEGADCIFYASTEIKVERDVIDALIAEMDSSTLAAGLRLDGHIFSPGLNALTGPTSPWNTATFWRIKDGLDRLGFISTGEAYFDPTRQKAGVEEVNCLNTYQALYGDCQAKLVQAPGTVWDIAISSNPETVAKKLATKGPRPEAQRQHAQLRTGTVLHIA